MSSYYELYREERTFLRRTKISKSRKIAVYRQMILCSQKGYELLKILHRYENDFLQLPPDKQELIRRQIDYLTDTHEQLLLTYIDKVSVDLNYAEKHFSQDPKDLMKLFLNEMEEFDKVDEDVGIDQYHLMRIIACIFAYQETVDYLEKLMHSFKLRHNEENKIDIDVHES
ncbi:hypothetical protein PGRAN_12659 [Listeria grandensis FSL F6-0971]|nr:hypothetical protein PGRAN_12659 [Listeria grandensis FSL F6-0971]